MGKSLMGSYAYYLYTHQALADGKLDLSAWQGYQELYYTEALEPTRIDFELILDHNAHASFLFNKTEKGYSGFLFSASPYKQSVFFTATSAGKFIRIEPLSFRKLPKNREHQIQVNFEKNRVRLFINQQETDSFVVPLETQQIVGFRGGLLKATIDKLHISKKDGGLINETFENTQNRWLLYILFSAILIISSSLLFFLISKLLSDREKTGFYFILVGLLLLLFNHFFGWYQIRQGRFYPEVTELMELEQATWKGGLVAKVEKRAVRQYSKPPEKNEHRILFIGSSQTWGDGASSENATFVKLFEQQLNAQYKKPNQDQIFKCINAGVPAIHSTYFADTFDSVWLKLKPETIYINLATNDSHIDYFTLNIEKMIRSAKQHHVEIILMLEANAPDKADMALFEKHDILRRLATENHIPYIDMHAYLRRLHQSGFIWWDWVHMSDYGHQLVTHKLLEDYTARHTH
jgi:lysophospholipase L1-like esterase